MKTKKIAIIVTCMTLIALLVGAAVFLYYSKNYFLTLKGDNSVNIGLNGTYKELGATAVIDGKDASERIKISSDLDTTTPGKYTVKYTCGSLDSERTVIVADKMNPVLRLDKGKEAATFKLGEPYEEPLLTAVDESGKDITSQVKVGSTDFKRTGSYRVPYTVEDGKGNSTTIYRQVEVLPNTQYQATGLPICMYHYVYDENDPPEDVNRRYNNYIEVHALEEELVYLKDNDYYFPTWKEVRQYVDGELILPDKSIVLSFDDGAKSFLELGIPLLEKYKIPATCFMITNNNGKNKVAKYRSEYVTYQSHSSNMHVSGGDVGHGGIITVWPEEEVLKDLKESIEICRNGDAFAYPYGDYTEQVRNTVEKANFLCAVTTQAGKVYPGDDPYLLDRVRMVQGQSLQGFIYKIH